MHLNAAGDNETTTTLAVTLTSSSTTSTTTTTSTLTKIPPFVAGVRPNFPYPPRPTVSLDARPIVIPILSCVFSFPVLAFAIICALRYRAQRLRRKDHLKRLQGGHRSVTLDLPPGAERPSFFSRDSSSDITLKQQGEIMEDYNSIGPTLKPSDALSSRHQQHQQQQQQQNNNHVKFSTTTAVLHVLRRSSTVAACGGVRLDPALYECNWPEPSDPENVDEEDDDDDDDEEDDDENDESDEREEDAEEEEDSR